MSMIRPLAVVLTYHFARMEDQSVRASGILWLLPIA
jgi:hypothetical protein